MPGMKAADVVSSAYTKVMAGALFPLHEQLRGFSSVARRRALERSQWLPAEEIAALQLSKLRDLLGRAARDVPYYRELFRLHGFDPGQVRALSDLARVPFLTKAAIRGDPLALKSAQAGPLSRANTGGS